MFYKLENENTIRKAPKPLQIGGKDVFTNSEEIHNKQGYYRLVNTEYPQDKKTYKLTYTMGDNVILQNWVEVEAPIIDESEEI